MHYKINCYIEPHYPVKAKILKETAKDFFAKLKIKFNLEINVAIVGNRKMKSLNKQYRGKDEAADVLSFPLSERKKDGDSSILSLGDVLISYPQALDRAIREGKLVDDIIKFLLIHGILHILGYDHQEAFQANTMERIEREFLSSSPTELGTPNV